MFLVLHDHICLHTQIAPGYTTEKKRFDECEIFGRKKSYSEPFRESQGQNVNQGMHTVAIMTFFRTCYGVDHPAFLPVFALEKTDNFTTAVQM